MTPDVAAVEEHVQRAVEWLVSAGRPTSDGVVWAEAAGGGDPDFMLYSGTPGVVVALLEAHRHFGDERLARSALDGARAVAAAVESATDCSLYFGLTGMAFALRATGTMLDTREFEPAVTSAVGKVRASCQDGRWGDFFELLGGNAGIALGALALGEPDLAVTAVEHYRRTAEPTAAGVTWQTGAMFDSRLHHVSHGTLGVAMALAATATAAGQPDLMDLALTGVADVVSRNQGPVDGFLVPHSDPQLWPDRIARFSYGWCHGATGDAQLFRYLYAVTGESRWADLVQRCWRTVTGSGLPARTEPGFWDNSGHCCGTAGVLAFAVDHAVDSGDDGRFADVLVADLVSRARADGEGVRWSNVEHRADPPILEPRTGWAMGSAGIIIELLRWVRLMRAADPAYAVRWPDHHPLPSS